MLRRISILFTLLCLSTGIVGQAAATVITTPSILNNGEQYRLVFVTSTISNAYDNNDIAYYNNLVTAEAANSAIELTTLNTTWSVIGSTEAVDARDNTATNPNVDTGVSIFLVDGTKLADNYADFWGGLIASAMNIDGFGNLATGDDRVFTGSLSDGTEYSPHALGNCCNTRAAAGSFNATGASAINNFSVPNKGESHRFYAMSGVLTAGDGVAVSTPGSLSVMVLALAVMGSMRRGRTE